MKKKKVLVLLLIMLFTFIIGNISSVKAETVTPTISFRSDTVEPGGKIYVDMQGVDDYAKSKKIYGFFSSTTDPNEQGGMFSLELEDVYSDNPYFETSSYMIIGHTYIFHSISLGDATYTSWNNGVNPAFNTNGKNEVKVVAPLSIDRFQVESSSKEVTKKDKVKFIVDISNADEYDLNDIGIMIRNIDEPTISAYGYMNRTKGNEYIFDLSKAQGNNNLTTGEYIISSINIFPKKGGTAIQFLADDYYGQERNILISDSFKIIESKKENTTDKQKENKKTEEFLNKVTIKKTNAKINEKVEISFDTKKKLSSAILTFINDTDRMKVEVKDLSKKPYFIIPFTTNSGTYSLDNVTLKDVDGKEYKYRKGENYSNIVHFDFNNTITIDDTFKDGSSISIENDKLTTEILEKIKKINSKITLEINANDNPIIGKELFDCVKDSGKTIVIRYNDVEWTFKGSNIQTIKSMDVSANYYKVSKENKIKNKVKTGFVLDFNNNGKLPGKTTIKVYNNDEFNDLFNNKNINIYYYNEDKNIFEIIDLNTEFNEKGYYEFDIEHTSKYILTTEKIDKKYLTNKVDVDYEDKNNSIFNLKNILLVSIPSLIIIILIVVIIIRKKKNKKKTVITNDNEDKVDTN